MKAVLKVAWIYFKRHNITELHPRVTSGNSWSQWSMIDRSNTGGGRVSLCQLMICSGIGNNSSLVVRIIDWAAAVYWKMDVSIVKSECKLDLFIFWEHAEVLCGYATSCSQTIRILKMHNNLLACSYFQTKAGFWWKKYIVILNVLLTLASFLM